MKRITCIVGTIGLLTVLSSPAWAEGRKTCFTTRLDPVSIPPTGVTFTDAPAFSRLTAQMGDPFVILASWTAKNLNPAVTQRL